MEKKKVVIRKKKKISSTALPFRNVDVTLEDLTVTTEETE
jgi:hypothetical protein